MQMYYLEIETENKVKKILNPRKSRVYDMIFRCFVKIMDGNGNWHLVGHCFYMSDAEEAADEINVAIKKKRECVSLELQ